MLERGQINAAAAEADTLGLEEKALLHSEFAGQRDASAGAKDALPRETGNLIQDLCDMARISWVAGGFGNCTVGADLSARYPTNGGRDGDRNRRFVGGFNGHGSR